MGEFSIVFCSVIFNKLGDCCASRVPNVGFSAVYNKVPLEVTAKLVHDFVADKALEIGDAREAVLVVI
jgi:hypothetical protein